jgi:hypothetical protein
MSKIMEPEARQSASLNEALKVSRDVVTVQRASMTLPAMSIAALRRHYVRQLVERAVAGSRWSASGFVFTTPVNRHY